MKRAKLLKPSKKKAKRVSVAEQLLEQPGDFVSSGCTTLDLVMGNGYPIGRVVNIVGDKSTGKTLLAIEAMANFHKRFPDSDIHYLEAESAFDIPYAESLGFPVEAVNVIDNRDTIEDFFEILQDVINREDTDKPSLVIVDSLDALSDRTEKSRKIDENTMGMNKATKLSQMFRRQIKGIGQTNILVLIISQVRDNIGVTFGRKSKRSGGRSLDFYASIVLYLAEKKKRTKEVNKVRRVVGVDVVIKCDKNKIAAPFRECEVPITFGYGMEEFEACVTYLQSVNMFSVLQDLGMPKRMTKTHLRKFSSDPELLEELKQAVRDSWNEVETWFSVDRRKY